MRKKEDYLSIEKCADNAHELEVLLNSFGTNSQLERAVSLFGRKTMIMTACCLIRQIHRATFEDFCGYRGCNVMVDDRNKASFEIAKLLMSDQHTSAILTEETPFFTPQGMRQLCDKRFVKMYLELLNNGATPDQMQAAITAVYFMNSHRTLQQNLFRICCRLLTEEGIIERPISLPYI